MFYCSCSVDKMTRRQDGGFGEGVIRGGGIRGEEWEREGVKGIFFV
jgi:hypothetical protein